MVYVKYNTNILAIQTIEVLLGKKENTYHNKYRHIRICLPHNNVNSAIKILDRNSTKKVNSHIVFAFNVFDSKNKTMQSQ